MELFKSLEKKTKLFNDPFKHFEINEPLTKNAIDEICNAEIADPRKQNLNSVSYTHLTLPTIYSV